MRSRENIVILQISYLIREYIVCTISLNNFQTCITMAPFYIYIYIYIYDEFHFEGLQEAFAVQKIGSMVGVESGHAIGSNLGVL